MSITTDHVQTHRRQAGPIRPEPVARATRALRRELSGVIDDLGTVLLAGVCLAGAVIVASTFDGDLEGSDEIVAAILGTLSLFAILAALELADRIKGKRPSNVTRHQDRD